MSIISSIGSAVYDYVVVPAVSLAAAEGVRITAAMFYPPVNITITDTSVELGLEPGTVIRTAYRSQPVYVRCAIGISMFVAGIATAKLIKNSPERGLLPIVLSGVYSVLNTENPRFTLRHIIPGGF